MAVPGPKELGLSPTPHNRYRHHLSFALFATACAAFLFNVDASAQPPESVHEYFLEANRDAPTFSPESVRPAPTTKSGHDAPGVVMGYLPYWESPEDLPWQTLDIVAWFSVEMNADGSLGSNHGWTGTSAGELIRQAHAADVSVVLSVTRFGGDSLEAFFANTSAAETAIGNLVELMTEGGGDGLDIDFEGLRSSRRDDYTEFIEDLREALDREAPGSLLTQAVPAVDWRGAYDYQALAAASDYLFIMGYAFSGSWSDPKPNAPLDSGDLWGSRDLRWSARDYVSRVAPEHAERVLMGLPLYGHTWEVDSEEMGVEVTGDDWVNFYYQTMDLWDHEGTSWEPVSATPWTAYNPSTLRQSWYEDVQSISLKAEMAREEGLGGFGFWALGYSRGHQELWDEVAVQRALWDEDWEPAEDAGALDPGPDMGPDIDAGLDLAPDLPSQPDLGRADTSEAEAGQREQEFEPAVPPGYEPELTRFAVSPGLDNGCSITSGSIPTGWLVTLLAAAVSLSRRRRKD